MRYTDMTEDQIIESITSLTKGILEAERHAANNRESIRLLQEDLTERLAQDLGYRNEANRLALVEQA